jgi:glycerophosphoryl diester phosphodiesterase
MLRLGFGLLVTIALGALGCSGASRVMRTTPSAHVAHASVTAVIGHRGAPRDAVENTLDSMDAALRAGANGLELDLCLTRDGEVVVWHDWDSDAAIAHGRQLGLESKLLARPDPPPLGDPFRKPIHELTLAEVREHFGYAAGGTRLAARIPTIEEFLAWTQGKHLTHVLFDMKVPPDRPVIAVAMARRIEAALARTQPRFTVTYLAADESTWSALDATVGDHFLSFDHDVSLVMIDDQKCARASSGHVRAHGPSMATTVKPEGVVGERWSALLTVTRCDLARRDEGDRAVQRVFTATIDEEDEMRALLREGVDGLVTNDTRLLRTVALSLGRTVE